jgi:hypothetical protein
MHQPIDETSPMPLAMLVLMLMAMGMGVMAPNMGDARVPSARHAVMSAEPFHATSMPEKSHCSTSTTTT